MFIDTHTHLFFHNFDEDRDEVIQRALDAGVEIINDVSALERDKDMAGVVREYGAGVVLMHSRGTPDIMQNDTGYTDIGD